MTQLDEYPLGLLPCPVEHADPFGHRCWNGNDRMILGFMQTHMYSAEIQHIAQCTTSATAFRMLRIRHEKRSNLTQLQLIQKLMQITFDDEPESFESNMADYRDLIYRIESIGHVDVNKLGLLFLLLNIKTSHPGVHDALAPSLMDGSVSVELMEARMQYHFEMHAAHQRQQQLPTSSIALPAQMPLRSVLCPNCKKVGHMVEFCIAPGGKMEGLSMQDAINRQRIIRDTLRNRPKPKEDSATPSTTPSVPPSPSSNSTLIKMDNDVSVWIGGIHFRQENKISAALADSVPPEPSSDTEEYPDWPGSVDTTLDSSIFMIASDVTLLS